MQDTSVKWQEIVSSGEYYTDTKLAIGSREYGTDALVSMSITQDAFKGGTISVGGCVYSRLDVKLAAVSESIPRMARLTPYVRVTDGVDTSEWLQMGVFFIDRRSVDTDTGVITIRAYDALMMTEQPYMTVDSDAGWPKRDRTVVYDVCSRIGVQLEPNTVQILNKNYLITYPFFGDAAKTVREVMEHIASAYCGNWIINAKGQLQLIQLNALPEETNLLIQSDGSVITVGGVGILIG